MSRRSPDGAKRNRGSPIPLRCIAAISLALLLGACATPPPVHALRHIGTAVLARQADGVTRDFGGISGADFDPATGVWYLLSDDRSQRAPARFYTATIELDATGFKALAVTGVVPLRQADGGPYPSAGPAEVPDPEALRLDPRSGNIVWASEGDRRLGQGPFVRQVTRAGAFVAEVPLPGNLKVRTDAEIGPRNNLSIEGLAFDTDAATLWVAMESPLYQDGPLPSLERGGFARFTRIDRQGRVLGQYAYPVDAIPVAATGGRMRADNGVSEILAIDDRTLLVVERSGREVEEQRFEFAIRLYEATVGAATDVAGVASLAAGGVVPMNKRLVLDLGRAGLGAIDNIEAAAWGPRLANGNPTLVLVSDDNFQPGQRNQFLAFEWMPRRSAP